VPAEEPSGLKYRKRSQYKYAKEKKYRLRNWAAYNDTLRRWRDPTIWFCEAAIEPSATLC